MLKIDGNLQKERLNSAHCFSIKNNYTKNKNLSVPISFSGREDDADTFITKNSADKKTEPVSFFNSLLQNCSRMTGKTKEKLAQKTENNSIQQKINVSKLKKLFFENAPKEYKESGNRTKELINNLAKHNYNDIEEKYNALKRNYAKENDGSVNGRLNYKFNTELHNVYDILAYDKIEPPDIDCIFDIKRSVAINLLEEKFKKEFDINKFVKHLKDYDDFDYLPATQQMDVIENFNDPFIKTALKTAGKAGYLNKFDCIADLGPKHELVNNLRKRMKNAPCKAINVDKLRIEKVFKEDNLDEFAQNLCNTDFSKYKEGLPLEYSRQNYIHDFIQLTQNLSEKDKKKIFDVFQFKITSSGDIINFPNLDIDLNNIDENLKEIVIQGKEITDKFMLQNKVKLNPEDKKTENSINEILKAFPELISITGKQQETGDSVDCHTLETLKKIYNNSRYSTLPKSEQKILTMATLFHDFGKREGRVDDKHAQKSAIIAKEIIKKTSLTSTEKERIYNLINHSHWNEENTSNEDIAFVFRHPNDFKMAKIFEESNQNSDSCSSKKTNKDIMKIKKNIEKINSNGILLFANSLPKNDRFCEKTKSGLKYIDLRNPEADVEKYGYPKGTKAKDLKFLCHLAGRPKADFKTVCDDSKEICLSTSYLDTTNGLKVCKDPGDAYIVNCSNANIINGGKDVFCTGGQRGYNYAIEEFYEREEEIPQTIKADLMLSDKEYVEIYNKISNLQSINEIENVELSTGRTIPKEILQNEIKQIQDYMTNPGIKSANSIYTNEFVIFNPKIEGQIVSGETPETLDSNYHDKDMTYVLV